MAKLTELIFNNTYQQLPAHYYSRVQPQGLEQPYLVSANPLAARLIDLDVEELTTRDFLAVASGNQLLPAFNPIAMVYAGHQFGGYSPQLGDGRGILLGEAVSKQHGKWDLHLKGAGKTPYSRFGDGRAVLRSCIREYLCSEAMAGLGISTTRALCITGSSTPVYRESVETGAMLLRLAKTHIRFGHFEYFHYNQQPERVRELADYSIDQYFPDAAQSEQPYYTFFQTVVDKTAALIAAWQVYGFAHGVMNTDNMSIIGDTFDYGPFGFLDDYEPGFICNHSDHQGRYAFNRQPSVGLWNLNALAHALSSLLSSDQLTDILSSYETTLVNTYLDLMRKRLGLSQAMAEDGDLINQLQAYLSANRSDYTVFFRQLCDFEDETTPPFHQQPSPYAAQLTDWLKRYDKRLRQEHSDGSQRREVMRANNPKYILRNYLAQQAIDLATGQQDFTMIDQLLRLLQNPCAEHTDFDDWSRPPPEWGKHLEISCSS